MCAAGSLCAQSTLLTIQGNATDEFSIAVASAGDVDQDGFDDVLIGSPKAGGGGMQRGRIEVRSGRDDSMLFEAFGDADFQQLGFSVSGVGDVNMDSVPDFSAGTFGGNYARVWSGLNGDVIGTYTSIQAGDLLGHCVSGVGDVNNDGYDDVIVGSNRLIVFAPGFARVYSGIDGSELETFNGNTLFDGFGTAVGGGGDVNNDNIPDYVVGGKGDDLGGTDAGIVRVFSGADGSELHTFIGSNPDNFFGTSVDILGDLDGDGFDEIVAGAPGCGVAAFCPSFKGYVRVFSGQTGNVLFSFTGREGFDNYGISVRNAGDVDGDGISDILIGCRNSSDRTRSNNGSMEVRSGATGAIIYRAVGDATDDAFGISVASGDFNGDGIPDALVGSLGGYARTRSIRLGRNTNSLSLVTGGKQALSLVAGPAFAGFAVAIMGTTAGTSPGLKVGSAFLPLNLTTFNPISGGLLTKTVFEGLRRGESKWLSALVTPGIGATPITVRVGYLNDKGEAHAVVTIPPGAFAGLAGTTLNHAYLVFDPVAERAIFASNAAALDLTL